jgi:hypothetical protein
MAPVPGLVLVLVLALGFGFERNIQTAMNTLSTARLRMPPRDREATVAMTIITPANPYTSLCSLLMARVAISATGKGASISI